MMANDSQLKISFAEKLESFARELNNYVSTENGDWTVKGFVDVYRNVYTISSDTKIVSKILEIHLFPLVLEFANKYGYALVPAEHQNYYPDISFVLLTDPTVKFAVDFKTTYRLDEYPGFCNGFTLGSHGEYFTNRESTKNIQFPYSSYLGHFCLGAIYTRTNRSEIDETRVFHIDSLQSITSVISDLQFFTVEKWKIASERSGSGNTANIGSIQKIDDILAGRGMFSNLGEEWFDDYWMNYGRIIATDDQGRTRRITSLEAFIRYRGGDPSRIVKRAGLRRRRTSQQ